MNAAQIAESLRHSRQELLCSPPISGNSLAWSAKLTRAADVAWQELHQLMASEFPAASRIAIIATGGYGRSDLAPYSDLDVALVPPPRPNAETDEAVKWLFREAQHVFSDANALQLGYAYRPLSDVPGFDAQTLSSLIDARFVAGVPELFEDLVKAIWESFPVGEFIVAKRDERELQTARTHDTPLVVEPHLKLGAGGLRCVQTARLIRAALGERLLPLPATYEVVHQARVLLQHCAGRSTDELTRTRLEEVAEMLGYDPRSLASALSGAMEDNHDLYLDSLERLHDTRFRLSPGVEVVRGEARPAPFATVGQACAGVHLAMRLGLRINPHWGALDPAVGSECVDLLIPCEHTVRTWHKCGVLGQALPELERCHTMISHDASHRYTVYEHTLQAARLIDRVLPDHPIAEIKAGLPEPGLLMLALLLHDVGKADRRAPHSETGARMAIEVCQRWGIERRQGEFVSWLVKEHLTMSKFSRLRDIELPETIEEFAGIVETKEKLDALTVLTWADIQAVAPHAWSPIQESFLLELYR
ncbi:MAG: HD domain-containing protein, partial [bacterium]